VVIDVVFVIIYPGGDEAEFAKWAGGGEKTDFASGVAVGDEEEVGAAAGAFDVDAKAFVGFFIKQRVGGGIAEGMAIEAVGTFGDGVFDNVKEVVTGRPRGTGDAFGAKGQDFAGAEVFDFEGVLTEASGIGGVGEKMVVVGDFKTAEAEEGLAFGEGVEIEEDLVAGGFLSGFIADRSAEAEWILLAFHSFRGVEIAAQPIGNREVGLLDAGEHLVVEKLLEGFAGLKDGVGVGIFGFEMVEDGGILLFAEPRIFVDAEVAVKEMLDRLACRHRRLGKGVRANGGGVVVVELGIHFSRLLKRSR